MARPANVAGNERVTGSLGAAIFALLFVEGLTIPRVREFISVHIFVGMLLLAFVVAKIASTTYRFARYYSGQRDYVEKGPPPWLLRVLGPVVSVLTVAVLATGIALVLDRRSNLFLFAHKASFVLWFCVMTVHVLGHARETPALALADWRRSRRGSVPRAPARFVVLAVVLAAGVAIALASRSWAHNWDHLHSLPRP